MLFTVGVSVTVTGAGVFVCVGVPVGVQVGGISNSGVGVSVGGRKAGIAVRGGMGLNMELGDAKIASDTTGHRQARIRKKIAGLNWNHP